MGGGADASSSVGRLPDLYLDVRMSKGIRRTPCFDWQSGTTLTEVQQAAQYPCSNRATQHSALLDPQRPQQERPLCVSQTLSGQEVNAKIVVAGIQLGCLVNRHYVELADPGFIDTLTPVVALHRRTPPA
jgi:hypothetical protein